MSPKQLEPDSSFNKYDANGDGIVSDDELAFSERLQNLEMEHEKADAQRKMCWFALWGMLLYPSLILGSSFVGLNQSTEILGDIAAVYFVAVAGVIATFFGTQVWAKK